MTPKASIISGAIALLGATVPAATQDYGDCPAPIRPGDYEIILTSSMAIADLYEGGAYAGELLTSLPTASFNGTVTLDACQNEFTLKAVSPEGIRFKWDMVLSSWTGQNGPEYTGTWTGNNVSVKQDITLPDTETLAMQATTKAQQGNFGLQVRPFSVAKSLQVGPLEPVECACRSKLQDWIDGRVENAETFRDLFANTAYRQRPAIFPPDRQATRKWKPSIYKEVINYMAGADMTFEEAAEVVAHERWPDEMPTSPASASTSSPASGGGAASTPASSGTEQAALTNLSSCTVEYGTVHLQQCYARIEFEATKTHEGVHVHTCDARGMLSEVPDLNAQAADEVLAYQTEIDFLESWITDNCN